LTRELPAAVTAARHCSYRGVEELALMVVP
jgi:hypothetical protein